MRIKLFLNIISLFVIFSCTKSSIELPEVQEFYRIKNSIEGEMTSFLFFTDPHLNENNSIFEQYLLAIKDRFNRVPLEFCICGGDWLDNNDTNKQAYDKLSYINDYTNRLFGDQYYYILGNHDTNYQGRLTEDSEKFTGLLDHNTIVDLMFSKQGNSYYTIDSKCAKIFVLDTGIDWDNIMDDFRWEQIYWFAKELQGNDNQNVIVAMHIYTNDLETPTIFSGSIMRVIEAYNNKTEISLNGYQYDFKDSIGNVACVLCGHCHKDFVIEASSIPIIGVTHLKDGNIPSFDFCVFDWKQNILNLIRVGTGVNRCVKLLE